MRKLTPTELERIHDLLRQGINRQAIAERFGIPANRVTEIAADLRKSGVTAPMNVREGTHG